MAVGSGVRSAHAGRGLCGKEDVCVFCKGGSLDVTVLVSVSGIRNQECTHYALACTRAAWMARQSVTGLGLAQSDNAIWAWCRRPGLVCAREGAQQRVSKTGQRDTGCSGGRSRPSRRFWLATSLQPGSEGENVSNQQSAMSTQHSARADGWLLFHNHSG